MGQQLCRQSRGRGRRHRHRSRGKGSRDGYTLLFGTSAGLTINPALSSKLPYDAVKDFAPVSLLVINPQILVLHNSIPANTVKELIAYAKARPGQLNYASVGQGSPNHMGMELLKALAGIDLVHVPYKGTGPAITDLLGGQVQLMFNSMPSVLPLVKSGKLKGLGVGSPQRSPAIPELPTVAEAGCGFEMSRGMECSRGQNPRDIVMNLISKRKILAEPEWRNAWPARAPNRAAARRKSSRSSCRWSPCAGRK